MVGKVVVSVFSLILVVGVVIGVVAIVQRSNNNHDSSSSGSQVSTSTKSIEQICQPTDYKEVCVKSLRSVKNTTDPKEYVKAAILATVDAATKAFNLSNHLIVETKGSDKELKMSLEDCKDLLEDAVEELQASLSTIGASSIHNMDQHIAELQNWLSAVVSYQDTCLDQFGDPYKNYRSQMKDGMLDATQLTSNALAIVNALSQVLSTFDLKFDLSDVTGNNSRRLLSVDENGFPDWLSGRRLMAVQNIGDVKPNVTVAQDGTGDVKTIAEAVAKITLNSSDQFIIYVKAGKYNEYITLEKKMVNVFMYGDGPNKTIITGSHSNHTGWRTFRSATFAALGAGFTAKNMAFENTAGPEGHQAVAVRVQADKAAFFNCKIDGYQDTLYTQAHRQFYSKCSISGTIDFIFGDASVIIQDSDIFVRLPLASQLNTVTAHGRTMKHETTGLIVQNCRIVAEDKLYPNRTTVKSYLGRPWKNYSRTVVMESEITDVIQPEGWLPWNGDLYLDTLEYYEYANTGAGAATDKRVKWKGFRVITDKKEAEQFTAGPFIQGAEWLNDTDIPFYLGFKK